MNPRILVVDDEANVLSGLQRALHREPYEVILAASAIDALGILRSGTIDVIVSDLEMPGMNGIEFLTNVRRLYPDTARIMLTGRPSLDVVMQAINEGAVSCFITKPCRLDDLIVAIRQCIDQRRLVGAARRLLEICRRQTELLESPGGGRPEGAPAPAEAAASRQRPQSVADLLAELEAEAGRAERVLSHAVNRES